MELIEACVQTAPKYSQKLTEFAIKGLRSCTGHCDNSCPYYKKRHCIHSMHKDALDVIASLLAEVERMKSQPTTIRTDKFTYTFPKKDGDGE